MATIKANKDKARFVSNTISQDVVDGDWADHEVVTKYKLPEIVIESSTTTTSIESLQEILDGAKLKVLDGASMVERTAGTVTTTGGPQPDGSLNTSTTDAVPTMTSNTSPSGVVSASSIYSALYDAYYAFNDIFPASASEDGWAAIAGQAFGWLQYKFPAAKVVNKYTITPQYSDVNRAPKNWTIEASNTGAFTGEEVVLETHTNEPAFTLGVKKTFSFTNATAYLYYRINITLTQGATILSIGEMEFIEAISTLKYQAPIIATTNIPTKAYFNKTIDTTLSAEATGKCKSSTITQIGVL